MLQPFRTQSQRSAYTSRIRLIERDRSSIQLRQIANDRQSEARSCRGLVGADAALEDGIAHGGIKAWTVVVDRDEDVRAIDR